MSPIDPKDVEITRAKMEADDVRASYGGLMRGKRAVITGVANDRSIAWAIAQAFHAEGAELIFTYPGESMERRVRPLAGGNIDPRVHRLAAADDLQRVAAGRQRAVRRRIAEQSR